MSEPRSTRFTAVLFDVDGTLLDSTAFIVGAVEHTMRQHGRTPPTADAIARVLGPSLRECYQILAPGLDPAELCKTHRAWQMEHVDIIHPYNGAAECLQTLRKAGLRVAAVTARSKASSLGSLDQTGLAGLLEFTISAEDVTQTKPHPEALLLALDRLGVAPADAVMVGDTTADIEAGRAAGTTTIGALYGFHGEALADSRPDHLVRCIAEVPSIILR